MKSFKLFALLTVLLSTLPWLTPRLNAQESGGWWNTDNDIKIVFESPSNFNTVGVTCTYTGTPPSGKPLGIIYNAYAPSTVYGMDQEIKMTKSGETYSFKSKDNRNIKELQIRLYACTEITITCNGNVSSMEILPAKQGNKLKKLTIDDGSVGTLDIGDGIYLEEVVARDLRLTYAITSSANTALKKLDLYGHNLNYPYTVSAPNIEYLDLSQDHYYPNDNFKYITINNASHLKTLNVSNNRKLHTINTLDKPYSASLTELKASYCNFASLEKMGFRPGGDGATGLKTLKLESNQFTGEMDLSKFTGIEQVSVANNFLSSLQGLKYLSKLKFISCWGNDINNSSATNLMDDLYNRKSTTKGTLVFHTSFYMNHVTEEFDLDPNTCSKNTVQKAVAKNWDVREYTSLDSEEEGASDTDPNNTIPYAGSTAAILQKLDGPWDYVTDKLADGFEDALGKTEAGVDLPVLSSAYELVPGTKVTISVVLKPGFVVKEWTVNGEKQTTTATSLNITMGEAGSSTKVSVTAEKVPEYNVKYSVVGASGGTLTAATDKNETVKTNTNWIKGTKITFTAKPSTSYSVSEWTVNGTKQTTTGNTLTLTVDKTLDVQVAFAITSYTLNFGVEGGNGTLTAKNGENPINSGVAIPSGTKITFTATPAAGYEVDTWTVNGTAQAEKSNTFTLSITDKTDVKVSFKPIPEVIEKFVVTYSSGVGGTISATVPGGSEVEKGTSVTFTASPISDYKIKEWTVNGTAQASKESRLTLIIEAETDVQVTFEQEESVEALAADALVVYPNPASNLLNVSGLAVGAEARLVSLAGQVVAAAQADARGVAVLDVATLPEGEYLLLTPAAGRKVAIRR